MKYSAYPVRLDLLRVLIGNLILVSSHKATGGAKEAQLALVCTQPIWIAVFSVMDQAKGNNKPTPSFHESGMGA